MPCLSRCCFLLQEIFFKQHIQLISKSLEAIVIQEVTKKRSPFGENEVRAFILSKRGSLKSFTSIAKARLAGLVVREAEEAFRAENLRD